MAIEDLYAETLIQNYEHPRNKGSIADADAKIHEENSTCGDDITVYLKLEGKRLKEVRFEGKGCVISMGSASLVTEALKGKSLAEIESLGKRDLFDIIGLDPGPVRLHCASLSLRAIKEAVFAYAKKPVDAATKEL